MTEKKARSMHFCQKPTSFLLTYRDVMRGGQFPGCRITLAGVPNDCGGRRKVPTMSQVLSSIEYICFRKSPGSNMRAPNLLLSLGPI